MHAIDATDCFSNYFFLMANFMLQQIQDEKFRKHFERISSTRWNDGGLSIEQRMQKKTCQDRNEHESNPTFNPTHLQLFTTVRDTMNDKLMMIHMN